MEQVIELRTEKRIVCQVKIDNAAKHKKLAIIWSHVLGNRPRWCRQSMSPELVHEKAVAALESLGVTVEHLSEMAAAGVVEIQFPEVSENELWVAESLPWEHWICAASRDESLVVVRHLKVKRKATTRKPKNFTFIESAPGIFQGSENFDAERDLVKSGLSNLENVFMPRDLAEDDLAARIEEAKPDVIHFAGVDSMLGCQLKGDYLREEMRFYVSEHHGCYFKNTREKYDAALKHQREVEWPKLRKKGKMVDEEKDRLKFERDRRVEARKVAECLNSSSRKPLLIAFNTWYSNSRLASRCIAEGTGAVLCFHNSIDENIARLFYYEFYNAWANTDFDVFAAYVSATERVRQLTDQVKGSAIVLWTSESIVERNSATSRKQLEPTKQGIQKFFKASETASDRLVFADPSTDQIEDVLGVTVTLPKFLNYSMLHNGRSLLEKLHLWFRFPDSDDNDRAPNTIRGVQVEVMLDVGPESHPYRAKVNLGSDLPQIDLANESLCPDGGHDRGGVTVPLISELARKLDEAVRTSIAVHVSWEGQTLYRQTHAITLAPANEWKLDKKDTCWIPSFVQPRSPAVAGIIGAAQKYLRCLSDDANASFMGYQADDVAPQIQAIWSAIAFDYSLSYVSPPPSYRDSSQRLRTPSEVIAERRGTCADLAILMASCLEWIELYPVLLIAEKHAFVGYWKSDAAHTEFFERLPIIRGEHRAFHNKNIGIGTELPWVAGPDVFQEIQELIHPVVSCDPDCDQELGMSPLRALESVFLTKRKGLNEAYGESMQLFCPESEWLIKPGVKNETYGTFEALVDIKTARAFVTPLPIH